MNLAEYVRQSLHKAISSVGNMRKYSALVGVEYSTVNRFRSGRQDIANMPLKTMVKIFPELRIFCFERDFRLEQKTVPCANLEAAVLEMFRKLPPEEQLKCLTIIAANFPEQIRKETKR